MFITKLTSPQAQAFADKYSDAMDDVRKAYVHEVDRNGLKATLDDYIIQMQADIERHTSNMKNAKAIELAEKHADKLPALYVEYKFDVWTGAIRLSFEDYLPYVAKQRELRGQVGIA